MNTEKHIPVRDESEPPLRLTRRGRALVWTAGVALSLGLGAGAAELNDTDFHGEQEITISDENNITELVTEKVDGVAHVPLDAVTLDASKRNPEVLGDGRIDHDDIGKTVSLPQSVTK